MRWSDNFIRDKNYTRLVPITKLHRARVLAPFGADGRVREVSTSGVYNFPFFLL